MARHETTNEQYAAFLNAAGESVRDEWLAFDSRKCRIRRDEASRRWVTDAPRLPVVTVSLAGALAYCEWLSAATGFRHRLPTEIEWEKAARGTASSIYAYGDSYQRFAANQESGALREVGGYLPNGWGLHDLTGNAFEWCSDAYVADAWLLLEPRDRRDGTRPAPPPGRVAEFQILRGGSYALDGMYLRNSFRMRQRPGTRTDDFGFRVVRDAPPERGRP
jgi:formylglycine-generating enzyme required for sulfatase activity